MNIYEGPQSHTGPTEKKWQLTKSNTAKEKNNEWYGA